LALAAAFEIIAPTTAFDNREGIVARLFLVTGAFVFATASYLFLEKPVKSWMAKRKRMHLSLFPLTASLVAFFALLGGLGRSADLGDGFGLRQAAVHMAPQRSVASVTAIELRDCNEELKTQGVEWCQTNAESKQADVVLIGDSHARMLAPQLAQYYKRQGRTLHSFSLGETLGLINTGVEMGGTYSTNGVRSLSFAFDWAIKNKAKTIVLASRGPAYAGRPEAGLDDRRIQTISLSQPELRDPAEIFGKGLDATFARARAEKIAIVFIFENAEIGFDPKTFCIKRPFGFLDRFSMNPCAVKLDLVERDQSIYRAVVQASARSFPEVKVYDLNPAICDSENCYAVDPQGRSIYSDDNHLSAFGVQKVLESYRF
jgi:SGNH domain (fused to AT3 domains)